MATRLSAFCISGSVAPRSPLIGRPGSASLVGVERRTTRRRQNRLPNGASLPAPPLYHLPPPHATHPASRTYATPKVARPCLSYFCNRECGRPFYFFALVLSWQFVLAQFFRYRFRVCAPVCICGPPSLQLTCKCVNHSISLTSTLKTRSAFRIRCALSATPSGLV